VVFEGRAGLVHTLMTISLTDESLDRNRGEQLANQARQLRPDLPVLLTSGHLHDDIVRERRLGALASFLPKPYRRAQLAAAVAAARGRTAESRDS
jgi:FixJ family two-component response regulator